MKQFLFNHALEVPATITGLLNVYLAARANILNWLFGVVTVSMYIIIFFHVKLYADMSLYFLFLTLQFYGWYQWLHGGLKHTSLSTRKATSRIYLISLLVTISLFFGIKYLLQHYTDSTTVYMDAFTSSVSLVAQWMMSKKWLENWYWWGAVDVVAIKMYLIKHLYLTSGLYAVFLVLCVMGYYNWRREYLTAKVV